MENPVFLPPSCVCVNQDEGCQIKGSEVCNLTIQTVLDQFPSLHGCVCAWEEELCDSIQGCFCKTQLLHVFFPVHNGSASCLDQMTVCVSDPVCNRYLAPVLTACTEQQCDRDRCQEVTQQFYGSMPHNVAEMLVMCECEALDQSCLDMKTALHRGTCGQQTRICQDTVNQCVEDSHCRDLLKTFRAKCWSPEEAQCSNSDLQNDDCITQMDSALILGTDPECKIAFLATLGTALHYPCACEGMRNNDLLTCNMIHDVFHNRSRFILNKLNVEYFVFSDYLLYAFATVLLVGVVTLMPLAVVSKIW
uniref:GDNF/GAS1 domain-containing protein n=1 Tax=Sander lucioperca TaxID=283035 RepID=A0A8C9ZUB9_SANLU